MWRWAMAWAGCSAGMAMRSMSPAHMAARPMITPTARQPKPACQKTGAWVGRYTRSSSGAAVQQATGKCTSAGCSGCPPTRKPPMAVPLLAADGRRLRLHDRGEQRQEADHRHQRVHHDDRTRMLLLADVEAEQVEAAQG